MSIEDRFWAKVDKQEGDDPCWFWTACLSHAGYGRLGRGKGVVLAHRFAYELLVGPIPEGMELDHRASCAKRCVNPAHLRPTTHKQNHENRAGAQRNNRSSGVRGVTWHKKNKKWQAQTKHHGKYVFVGLFDNPKAAELAVIAKRNELFTHNDQDRVAG